MILIVMHAGYFDVLSPLTIIRYYKVKLTLLVTVYTNMPSDVA